MPDLRLSVVLCSYNGAAYLQPQLESLLAQTRLPNEVVVGDDVSADESWDLLLAFAQKARALGIDVHLTRHPVNLGYVENFSAMLRQATGDVLFLCDQDDVWRSDKLEMMASHFARDNSLMLLHSDARLIDARGDGMKPSLFESLEVSRAERSKVRAGEAFEVLIRRNIVTGATAAMRREVVGKALPVGAGWIHDQWLGVIAAMMGRVDFIDDTLIDYRQHGGNQIGIRKRTLKMKIDDMLLPPAKLISDKVGLLRVLVARLNGMEPPTRPHVERAEDMLVHFLVRERMGRWRISRVLPIVRELINGRYRRYGTGLRGAVRDFLKRN